MPRRPRDIGTAAETAVERCLQANGFPYAEKRRTRGRHDPGDITGTPGVVWEVKGGDMARMASDAQIEAWLEETERERRNVNADIGVLVVQRKGVGAPNAHRWWAVMRLHDLTDLSHSGDDYRYHHAAGHGAPVRMMLGDMCRLLRAVGYGEPLESAA